MDDEFNTFQADPQQDGNYDHDDSTSGRHDAASIAARLGGFRQSYTGWWNGPCPCCGEHKFGLKDKRGGGLRFQCGASESRCSRDDICAVLRSQGLLPDNADPQKAPGELVWPYDIKGAPKPPEQILEFDPRYISTPAEPRANPRYVFKNAEGRPLYIEERHDYIDANGKDRKWFDQWTLWRLPDGKLQWFDGDYFKFVPKPLPLFGLDKLAARPGDDPVMGRGARQGSARTIILSQSCRGRLARRRE